MKIIRFLLFAVLFVVVLQFSVFAEGSAEEQTESEKATVVLWDRSVNEKQYVETLTNKFKEMNPHINLVVQYYIKERDPAKPQPLVVALTGGEEIDVYSVATPSQMRMYYDMGKALDLKSLLESDNIDMGPFGTQYDVYEVNGEYPGLFYRSIYYAVYYNIDLFDKAGIAYPEDSMLWSEFVDVAKKVTMGSGDSKVYGTLIGGGLSDAWAFCVQNNHLIYEKESLPDLRASLEFEKSVWDSGASMSMAEVRSLGTYSIPEFEKETIAMAFEGEWLPGEVNNDIRMGKADVKYDQAMPPIREGTDPGVSPTFSCPLIINPDCRDLDAAWEVAKFYCLDEGAKILGSRGFLPAYKTTDAVDAYMNSMGGMPSRIGEVVPQLVLRPAYRADPEIEEFDKIFQEERQLMAIGDKTIDEAMADFEKRAAHLW